MLERIFTFFADLVMVRCRKCRKKHGTNKDCGFCRAANPEL